MQMSRFVNVISIVLNVSSGKKEVHTFFANTMEYRLHSRNATKKKQARNIDV